MTFSKCYLSFSVLLIFIVTSGFIWENQEGVFQDNRDNQTYKWMRLKDGKKWMVENMSFQIGKDKDCACAMSNLKKYKYNPEDAKCLLGLGRLYSWKAAKRVCPDGWRLPSNKDWSNLFDAYGGYGIYDDNVYLTNNDVGKETLKSLKKKKNGNFYQIFGTNDDMATYYWSSTRTDEYETTNAYIYGFINNYPTEITLRTTLDIDEYSYCRCVQD